MVWCHSSTKRSRVIFANLSLTMPGFPISFLVSSYFSLVHWSVCRRPLISLQMYRLINLIIASAGSSHSLLHLLFVPRPLTHGTIWSFVGLLANRTVFDLCAVIFCTITDRCIKGTHLPQSTIVLASLTLLRDWLPCLIVFYNKGLSRQECLRSLSMWLAPKELEMEA